MGDEDAIFGPLFTAVMPFLRSDRLRVPRFKLTQNLVVTAQVGWHLCRPGPLPLDDRRRVETSAQRAPLNWATKTQPPKAARSNFRSQSESRRLFDSDFPTIFQIGADRRLRLNDYLKITVRLTDFLLSHRLFDSKFFDQK